MDVPFWLQRWMGVGVTPGEGVAVKLHAHWPWPMWVTVLAVLLVVILVVRLYRREEAEISPTLRSGLIAMRLAVVAVVLAMLGQWVLTIERTGLPFLAVVCDDSASMAFQDQYPEAERKLLDRTFGGLAEKPARFEILQRILANPPESVAEWNRRYRVRVFFLDRGRGFDWSPPEAEQRWKETQPVRESSPLGEAVLASLDSLRGSPPAAVIVLSDGVCNEGPDWKETAAELQRRGTPLFFVGIGSPGANRDIRLTDLRMDDTVFLHDVVFADVRVVADGYAGRTVSIRVVDEATNSALASNTVVVQGDSFTGSVRLAFQADRVGTLSLRLEVPVQAGELHEENNVLRQSIRVLDEPIRVLYVEGTPRFEYRYLRNLLLREPSVSLDCVLQSADPEYAADAKNVLPGVPMRRDELWRYDVIVLGDVDPAWLPRSTLDDIAAFVRDSAKSGAVLFIAGDQFMPAAFRETPLASLLPFESGQDRLPDSAGKVGPLRMVPTEMGLASPGMQLALDPRQNAAVWEALPEFYRYVPIGELKPGARALAVHGSERRWNGDPVPLIVFQYAGGGKVLFHAIDETWRWRLRGGQSWFSRYWVQTLRFLARGKLERERGTWLESNQRVYRPGETVILRAVFRPGEGVPAPGDSVTVFLERDGSARSQLRLDRRGLAGHVYEGRADDLLPGRYRAWIAAPGVPQPPAANFEVEPPRREMEEPEPDFVGMKEAAEMTGGAFFHVWQLPQLNRSLPPGQSVAVERLPPVTLWNRPAMLLLLLGLLTGEWLIRRLRGLA
ncbi:MAG: hypothetical protein ACUVQQ_03435 [Thermogutta sp.]